MFKISKKSEITKKVLIQEGPSTRFWDPLILKSHEQEEEPANEMQTKRQRSPMSIWTAIFIKKIRLASLSTLCYDIYAKTSSQELSQAEVWDKHSKQ